MPLKKLRSYKQAFESFINLTSQAHQNARQRHCRVAVTALRELKNSQQFIPSERGRKPKSDMQN